ncbi:hypothetical protein [Hymenobacter elongatus]|uniref:Uncharacterized protein n=1 Tax=Hymenobacter elongatus TaxID=877208 RepID=A0A4Z0PEQ4_9BACT|nr:hypothetical protein [Hymenobacter elongatus]TGE12816.1 hypothetical protein E5J99_19960 [Hymenobacter elongatus]
MFNLTGVRTILLLIALISVEAVSAKNKELAPLPLEGEWTGIIGETLQVLFKITEAPNGQLTATLDVPAQGILNLSVASIVLRQDSVIIKLTTPTVANFRG